jgi:hypothetical protein
MQAELQRIEIEPLGGRNHDLAVDHAARRQLAREQLVQLGKIAIEGTQIAALNEHLRRAAKDDRAKAVPFRFVEKAVADGKLLRQLGQHRLYGRLDGKTGHSLIVVRSP